jgi:hypothetical protein
MLLHQVLNVEPPSPRKLDDSISRDLETICLKCLEKDPAKRYQTAKQLAEDLQRYIQGEPISARPISRPERTWRWCRRNPMAATAAALLTVIAVASPVIAVRERLHALESDKLNRENRKHIQQLTSERDKLRREATVPAEYLGFRQPGQISTGGRQFLRWAYDRYEPAMHEILRGAATPEERCMAALGLAILANQTKPPEDSLGLLLQARAELEQAAGSSANNLQLQAGLAFCYDSLGEVYGRLQEPDLDLAREYDEKAERVWRQLAQSDPTLANYRALAENQLNLAGHKRYEGSEAQVLSRLDQIEKTSQQHLDLFIPQSPRQLYEIACELAGCRPWLTHVPEAAVGVEVSADVDAPHK